ncbi:hypothetical protein M5K25_001812 [Dendrobium thyrsiflorum]|uniref:Uncharacterized protein n=1 Tax=Dendrobium thyrsiflorum TaxID=117978 RepID=A0ABD0W178_DENTH
MWNILRECFIVKGYAIPFTTYEVALLSGLPNRDYSTTCPSSSSTKHKTNIPEKQDIPGQPDNPDHENPVIPPQQDIPAHKILVIPPQENNPAHEILVIPPQEDNPPQENLVIPHQPDNKKLKLDIPHQQDFSLENEPINADDVEVNDVPVTALVHEYVGMELLSSEKKYFLNECFKKFPFNDDMSYKQREPLAQLFLSHDLWFNAKTNFSGTPYTPSKEDSRLKNEKNSFLDDPDRPGRCIAIMPKLIIWLRKALNLASESSDQELDNEV